MTSPVIEKRVPDRLFEGILRILILVLAVVAQFVLLVQLIDFLRINAVYIYFFLEILALVQVLILLNQKGINTYSIAWIIVIMVLPVFGELIYLFGVNQDDAAVKAVNCARSSVGAVYGCALIQPYARNCDCAILTSSGFQLIWLTRGFQFLTKPAAVITV